MSSAPLAHARDDSVDVIHGEHDATETIHGLDGPVRITRTRFRCAHCGYELYAADGLLLCGRHRVTRPLAKRACQLATIEHFTQWPQLLFDQHGVRLSHES